MNIRRFNTEDAKTVSDLIRKTIKISNVKDYPADIIDILDKTETPEHVIERAGWTHFYVAEAHFVLFSFFNAFFVFLFPLAKIVPDMLAKECGIFFGHFIYPFMQKNSISSPFGPLQNASLAVKPGLPLTIAVFG